jgi:hypothetical protein
VAEIVSSVLDVASVVFARVGDIVSVAFTFVVVSVLAPKPTFTWPELDDDEDDDDDDEEDGEEAAARTCEGEDPPEPVGADFALSSAVSNNFL